MVWVKTLRPHGNAYGDKYQKAEGAEYELPEAQAKQLVADGLAERVKSEAAADAEAAPATGQPRK